ncbi:MAG: NAD(P)-binding domain-containing protein [Bacteroidota bacterium]
MGKKVGIIGSGMVGVALANGFAKHGHQVMIGTRDPKKHEALKGNTGGNARVGDFGETAKFAEMVVLAVKGTAAEEAVKTTGADALKGKTVVDATNPITDAPPVNGVIEYFTPINESLMERLQKLAPEANFVKSFSSVGNALMVNPDFGREKPTMFICGNNDSAKNEVRAILDQFGWEAEDMGKAEAARAIEPLAMLWCIPGFLHNQWTHAFRLLKK